MKMKTLLIGFLATAMIFVACEKDEEDDNTQLNEDGLTQDITDLVPQDILDEMEDLGLQINGGGNPPSLENTYLASPFILQSSNISTDYVGMTFPDFYATFEEQDNNNLTIEYSYENGSESGSGLGGFIVGEDNDFTVFVGVTSENYYGELAENVQVISGTLASDHIVDLQAALFMIDNNGNPSGAWIENGQGRVIYDEDGESPVVASGKSSISTELTKSVLSRIKK
ncbi:hypothetical protein [Salinivirga cyanobacteriivorans]|uniref:Uncharacterized protein n=2 Tax=Salinivirgaceae TaxID=1970190 RepID=A0A0S2HX81_9BACT|nr:hypothetical protein L21SP5_00912 [Salinivirga cyanobacteriivorans]